MSNEKKLHSIGASIGETTGALLVKEPPILQQSTEQINDILTSESFSDATLSKIEVSRIERLKNPQTLPSIEEQRQYTRAQHYINSEIARFLRDSKNSKQSDEEYLKSFMRQMWLKQTSIITLRNEQYIDSFIDDLKCLHLKDPFLLEEYNKEYISEEVVNTIDAGHPQDITTTINGEIYFLLNYIWEIHGSGSRKKESYIEQYDFMKKLCYKIEDYQEIALENEIKNKLIYLEQINGMPDFFRDKYSELQEAMIKKYGITYINTLKNNPKNIENEVLIVPFEPDENQELLVFYLIEQTFLRRFHNTNQEVLEDLINNTGLHRGDIDIFFLFITALIHIEGQLGYNILLGYIDLELPIESWIYLTQMICYVEEKTKLRNLILKNTYNKTLLELFQNKFLNIERSSPLYVLIVGNIYYIQYLIDKYDLETADDIKKIMTLTDLIEDQYSKNLISPQIDSIYQKTLDMLASFYFNTNDIEKGLEILEKKLLSITQKSDIHKIGYRKSRELNIILAQHNRMGNKEKVNQWLQFGIREGFDMTNIKYDTTELSQFTSDKPTVIH